MKLIHRPFRKNCSTTSKHAEWGISENLELKTVGSKVERILLELASKTSQRDKKRSHKFCVGCVDHVIELRPDIGSEESRSPDHSYSTISHKRSADATPDNEGTKRPTVEKETIETVHVDSDTVKGTQTNGIFQLAYCLSKGYDVAELPDDMRNDLFFHMGRYLHQELQRDNAHMSMQSGKQLSSLMGIDLSNYLNQRNTALVSFLFGISGKNTMEETDVEMSDPKEKKILYKICKSVESVVNLTAWQAVFPVHLRESIMINSVGSTALSLQILASTRPYASYRTVRDWLDALCTSRDVSLDGDVIGVFDNNQTLQRRWRVQLDNKMYCNMVTVVAFFQVDGNGNLQCRRDLKPGVWLLKPLLESVKKQVK